VLAKLEDRVQTKKDGLPIRLLQFHELGAKVVLLGAHQLATAFEKRIAVNDNLLVSFPAVDVVALTDIDLWKAGVGRFWVLWYIES
jgi:hypothetical protein